MDIYAVAYADYEPAEIHSLYMREVDAIERANELNSAESAHSMMWCVRLMKVHEAQADAKPEGGA